MTDIYLSPASKQSGTGRAYSHLQNTVVSPISRSGYGEFIPDTLPDKLSIWGAVENHRGLWNGLVAGDYLLFYVGNERYRYAAEVIETDENRSLADSLWPDYHTTSTGGDDPNEPWSLIIYMEPAFEVEISGKEIAQAAGHSINYPMRFMRLNDDGVANLKSRFGSLEDYLQKRSREGTEGQSSDDDDGRSQASGSDESSNTDLDKKEAFSDIRKPKRVDTQVSRIIRNTAATKRLKRLYDYQCQVCGERRFQRQDEPYAEAHHIHPLGDSPPGPDSEENILILCPNHHADFDYGQIEVDPETLTIDHEYDDSVRSTLLLHDGHDLNEKHIRYHNQNNFAL